MRFVQVLKWDQHQLVVGYHRSTLFLGDDSTLKTRTAIAARLPHQPILVQVPQLELLKPASPAAIETIGEVTPKSLAMMSAFWPPNPLSRSQ